MAAGTIVSAWQDATAAYLAVLVNEGGSAGSVEYIGTVAKFDQEGNDVWTPLAAAEKKAALIAAVKAQRDVQQAATKAALAGLTGGVTI